MTQVARFACIGGLATATHYGVALALTRISGPYVANLCGYGAAVGVSYIGHQRFTFRTGKAPGVHRRHAPRFVAVSLSAFLLSQSMLAITQAVGLSTAISLAIAVLCIPPYTFTLSRLWVFNDPKTGNRRR